MVPWTPSAHSDAIPPRLIAHARTRNAIQHSPAAWTKRGFRPRRSRWTPANGKNELAARRSHHRSLAGSESATGRLVHAEAGDWFEPWHWVGWGGTPRRVRAARWQAVRIIGARFDDLANRFEDDGAVEGFATVTALDSPEARRAAGCPAEADDQDRLPFGSQNRTFPPEARRAIRERTPL